MWGSGPVFYLGQGISVFLRTWQARGLQNLLLISGSWIHWFCRLFPVQFRWVWASPVTATVLLLFSVAVCQHCKYLLIWSYWSTSKLCLLLHLFFRSLPCHLLKMLLLMGTDTLLILCTLAYVKKKIGF